MKVRVKMFALVFCACLLFASLSSTQGNFVDGRQYLQMPETDRNIYIMGLYDSWSFFSDAVYKIVDRRNQARMNRIQRCVKSMNAAKLRALIDNYIRADRARLAYNMGSNFDTALGDKCPRRR